MRLLAFILSCGLLFSSASFANDAAKLENLKQEIQKLQSWLAQAQQESDQLSSQLRQSDLDISNLNKEIETINAKLKEERDLLKKLRLEQGQLRYHQNKQKELLSEQIRSAQRLGQDGPIKLLLNQNDPLHVQRMLKLYGYFNEARIQSIKEIIIELNRLENIATEIQKTEQSLQTHQRQQQQKQRSLVAKQQQQKNILTQLNQRMSSEQKNLAAKEANRRQLEQLISDVEALLENSPRQADARPITQLKGRLPMPINGRILQAFGGKRNAGYNKGWLIEATSGTEVKAVHHGRVVFSDWLRGYGLVLLLDHGQGYLSLYAHNQSLLHDVGSWVYQNDVITTAGNSGGIDRTALYFEIRYRGQALDPAIWLKRNH